MPASLRKASAETPVISAVRVSRSSFNPGRQPVTTDERRARYSALLDELRADLDDLSHRFDPEIDPSTARTVELVGADVDRLLAHLG